MNALPAEKAKHHLSAEPEARAAALSAEVTRPFTGSTNVFVQGSCPDLSEPMREVAQSPTPTARGPLADPPMTLYDTSGPYTDPTATIDLTRGLPAIRAGWIADPAATRSRSPDRSSRFGAERLADGALDGMRFPPLLPPQVI